MPVVTGVQRLGPAAKRAVVGDGEIDPPLPFHALPRAEPLAAPPEQSYDGADQPLRLTQSQPEHCPQDQSREDGQGRVGSLPASGHTRLGCPCRDRLLGNPDR